MNISLLQMNRRMNRSSLIAVMNVVMVVLFSAITANATGSPVGFWRTIDDSTKEPRAVVEITENEGKLFGTILKTFPKEGDTPNCGECPGDKKDKPIIGLQIVWDLKKDGDEYTGGHILDPKNGKVYKAKIAVVDGGSKLKVRGFIGFSLLGRTQIWEKAEKPSN